MKNAHAPAPILLIMLVLIVSLFAAGCAGAPEPVPPPSPQPAPVEPRPEPAPEPEPEGHTPLVGTRWALEKLHGDMRTLSPVDGPTWLEFRPDGTVYVQGPQNTIEGVYRSVPDAESPKDAYNFEEGTLRGEDVIRNRRVGSYSEFEDVLLENLDLLKGYYIRGDTHAESTLTIWGGYRSEEVVLLELTAAGSAK
ncbi:MAG: hypothetical protein PF508_21605 [Spirochaeta sp.]|jgi:hypothetical protein|nr:hypothetical protein [Spirochaeta sp.]